MDIDKIINDLNIYSYNIMYLYIAKQEPINNVVFDYLSSSFQIIHLFDDLIIFSLKFTFTLIYVK